MTLTKAGMVEHLFDELGLNKREAKELVEMFLKKLNLHWTKVRILNYQASVILYCATNHNVQVETQNQVKQFL